MTAGIHLRALSSLSESLHCSQNSTGTQKQLEERVQTLQTHVRQQRFAVSNLQNEHEKALFSVQSQCEKLSTENKTLTTEIQKLRTERDRLRKLNQARKKEVEALDARVSCLEAQLKICTEQYEAATKRCEAYQQEIRSMAENHDRQQKEILAALQPKPAESPWPNLLKILGDLVIQQVENQYRVKNG